MTVVHFGFGATFFIVGAVTTSFPLLVLQEMASDFVVGVVSRCFVVGVDHLGVLFVTGAVFFLFILFVDAL
ncbi:hypothetical protein C2G38_2185519 [Gigaspora rosea]|uniref:Uncharacterized protein n=1 Tax=Gigaspora rosea TaxID=44941 RepID=A0A397V9Y4_9GLOM|nr:hypothetical protein C2G38_2185519 [Gigaspora rosea]